MNQLSDHHSRTDKLTADGTLFLFDETATEQFGRLLARATWQPGKVDAAPGTLGGKVFLSGDLGAGKTTLVRGLMRGYGYNGAVKSPTYTLVEPYESAGRNIYHFDLYRLADPEEVEFLGVWDYFDPSNLCLVEWPEKGRGVLPAPDLHIELQVEKNGRRVEWRAMSAAGRKIGQRLIELSGELPGFTVEP